MAILGPINGHIGEVRQCPPNIVMKMSRKSLFALIRVVFQCGIRLVLRYHHILDRTSHLVYPCLSSERDFNVPPGAQFSDARPRLGPSVGLW